jgi:hypothetical protein
MKTMILELVKVDEIFSQGGELAFIINLSARSHANSGFLPLCCLSTVGRRTLLKLKFKK